jgi:hypothetical protein
MPNRDGTGPNGGGPRTGRGNGNCPPPSNQQSAQIPDQGRPRWGWRSNREQGFGRGGTGFRRGRRFG